MTAYEKRISFLNRYVVFKKVRHVNAEKVELELNEYNEMDVNINKSDTEKAVTSAVKDVKQSKLKVRKLTKKLLLMPATEATDEVVEDKQEVEDKVVVEVEVSEKKEKKVRKKVEKAKKLIIIEDDE